MPGGSISAFGDIVAVNLTFVFDRFQFGGVEHLIPAAGELLREVDIEGRRIVVDVIPGLLESA